MADLCTVGLNILKRLHEDPIVDSDDDGEEVTVVAASQVSASPAPSISTLSQSRPITPFVLPAGSVTSVPFASSAIEDLTVFKSKGQFN